MIRPQFDSAAAFYKRNIEPPDHLTHQPFGVGNIGSGNPKDLRRLVKRYWMDYHR